MPHDRRPWLTLLIMIGIACSAVSIGCIKPSNLRPAGNSLTEPSPADAAQTGPRQAQAPPTGPALGQEPVSTPSDLSSAAQPSRANSSSSPAANATDPTVLQAAASPSGSVTTQAAAPDAIQPGAGVPIGPEPTFMPVPVSAPPPTPAPSSGPANPEPSPSSTPLLDAEIRRVEDVTRQHNESLQSSGQASLLGDPRSISPGRPLLDLDAPKPLDADSGPGAIMTKPAQVNPPESPLAEPAQLPIALSRVPTESPSPASKMLLADAVPRPGSPGPEAIEVRPHRASGAPERDSKEDKSVARADDPTAFSDESKSDKSPKQTVDSKLAAESDPASLPSSKAHQSLEIAALRLCSKVKGFGSFEPVNPDALKAGQILVAYWEFSGLEYETRGDSRVARLSVHLEFRPETGGPIVWEQTSQTEYVCRSPLRDNFAYHRVQLPKSMEPGPYRLRLMQTDLIAGCTASIELPLTIAP